MNIISSAPIKPSGKLFIILISAAFLAVVLLGTPGSVAAQGVSQGAAEGISRPQPPVIKLAFPLNCNLGEDCWVFNYVDVISKAGNYSDFSCGSLSYDKHKGTDIAVRDMAAMRAGVEVLSAALGRVVGVRDGVADVKSRNINPAGIKGRKCGNGVRLRHKGGWFTQYCHMQLDSIQVKKGDIVDSGQVLGKVGLSGKTEFPHLHFQVSHGKRIYDPFVGVEPRRRCGMGASPLWDQKTISSLNYSETVVYNGGFTQTLPLVSAVRNGNYKKEILSSTGLKIFLWYEIRNSRRNDKIKFSLFGPNGKKIKTVETVMKKTRSRRLQTFNVTSAGDWPAGVYRSEIVVTRVRKGKSKIFKAERKVTIK